MDSNTTLLLRKYLKRDAVSKPREVHAYEEGKLSPMGQMRNLNPHL
jgi:hypothetical protein